MLTIAQAREKWRVELEMKRISLALLDEGKALGKNNRQNPRTAKWRSHLRRSISQLEALLAKYPET